MQGVKLEDGCELNSYLELAPGETARLSRTVAINWNTCEYLEEEGTISQENVERLTEGDDDLESDIPQPVGSPGRSGASSGPMMSSNKVTKLKTGWKDPLNLFVNFVQTGIEWTVIGDIVVYRQGSCRQFHLSVSGWQDLGGTCAWAYGNGQQRVFVDQTRDYENDVFPCPEGEGADVTYSLNRVGAATSGPFRSVSTRATGDCAHLLGKWSMLYTNT
jgi:hypothetical protein